MKRKVGTDAINHQLWVISYADMVTLLFALFVVLYSLGEVKLSKLRELRRSLAFAFSYTGEILEDPDAIYDRGDRADHLEGLALIYGQATDVRQRLLQILPARFEALTGRPLEVLLTDESIEFRGPLDAFFEPGAVPMYPPVQDWLRELIGTALGFTSHIRVRIEAPNVPMGMDDNGRRERPGPLCLSRLEGVLRFLPLISRVLAENVETQFQYRMDRSADWEARGTIGFAFSNR